MKATYVSKNTASVFLNMQGFVLLNRPKSAFSENYCVNHVPLVEV